MTSTTATPLRERAAKGAAALDDIMPDWYTEIDVEELSITSGLSCVVGQLYGNWGERYHLARLLDPANADLIGQYRDDDYEVRRRANLHIKNLMVDHGLLLPAEDMNDADYWSNGGEDRLTMAWKEEVLRRRQQ